MFKVLIVDNEKNVREVIAGLILEEFTVEISFADDSFSAYHEACLEKFDLICLDHQMPYLNGGDFLKVLREKDGKNQDTPIIMLSAFIFDRDKSLLNSDNTYFLEKPINTESFSRYIRIIIYSNQSTDRLDKALRV